MDDELAILVRQVQEGEMLVERQGCVLQELRRRGRRARSVRLGLAQAEASLAERRQRLARAYVTRERQGAQSR
ncbi:MAG: hypothetical protein KGJ78_14225 [Alphaproteobacteria bacterium]|nr:hypothetical protein [Alphaproteobacteria bacterium]